MLSKIKFLSIGIIIGSIIGVIGMYFFSNSSQVKDSQIKTTQLSGEKISHSEFQFKGKAVSFKTTADGEGKIVTEIPKELIPEANAWMKKTHGIQLNYLIQYHGSSFFKSYAVSYYHRFGLVAIGGGIIASSESFGVQVGAQLWF